MQSASSELSAVCVTLATGFVVGFVGSIPITGPIALLVMSRGAERRYAVARRIGLGAALAEALYAALAYYGFGKLRALAPDVMPIARAISGVALTVVGLVFLLRRDRPAPPSRDVSADDSKRGFVLGFSTSVANPTLVGTWATVVAVLDAHRWLDVTHSLALPFGLAAGLGIACWELCFVAMLRRSEARVPRRALARVVRVTGAAVLAIGLHTAYDAVRTMLARGH